MLPLHTPSHRLNFSPSFPWEVAGPFCRPSSERSGLPSSIGLFSTIRTIPTETTIRINLTFNRFEPSAVFYFIPPSLFNFPPFFFADLTTEHIKYGMWGEVSSVPEAERRPYQTVGTLYSLIFLSLVINTIFSTFDCDMIILSNGSLWIWGSFSV